MFVTRSLKQASLQFDPEIEKTAKGLRKEAKKRLHAYKAVHETEENMAENQTLRELAAPDLNQ